MTATADEPAHLPSVEELYERPGFLIRRAHQITSSIFLDETAAWGITTTQFGVMVILRARDDLDQIKLAGLVGIDRSTAGLVVRKLVDAGYVRREVDDGDMRRNVLLLTARGLAVLDEIAAPAARAKGRALAVFTPRQAETFVDLLSRFVAALNGEARAPIRADEPPPLLRRRRKGVRHRRLTEAAIRRDDRTHA